MRRALVPAALAAALVVPAPARGTVAVAPPPVTASLDRSSAPLGDRVVATYEARVPVGDSIELEALVTPRLPAPPAPLDGAVLEFEEPELAFSEGGGQDARSFRLVVPFAAFASGEVPVPSPRLVYVSRTGQRVPFRPPSLVLKVDSRLPAGKKPEELAPKEDRAPKVPPFPWVRWAVAGLLLVAAAVALWLYLRKRRRAAASPGAAAASAVPPGTELLSTLQELRGRLPAAGSDPRGFYSDLTHAVKRYLERRLEKPFLEWTTFETIRRLREAGLDVPREIGLADLLAGADRVKFGRAPSTPEEADREIARARALHDHLEAALAAEEAARAAAAARAAKTAKEARR